MALDDPAGLATGGNLADVPLTSLLRSLAATDSRGILHLSGSYSSIVCFRDGEIYLAHAETGPSLRQVAVSAGVATEDEWDRAVEATRQGGTLIDALLSVADTPREQMRQALYDHTVNTLFELLVPSSNQFRFAVDEAHQMGAAFLFPVDEVLDAATRRLSEFTEIAQAIPSTDVVMRVIPRLPTGVTELTVSAVEWQILSAIDGRATVADLIATVGQSAFAVFSALHHLLRSGAIERADRAR